MEKNNNGELESVRYLLRKWRAWRIGWFPDLGAPHAVPFVDGILGARPMDGYDDPEGDDARIHALEMRAVDQAIERDITSIQRAALNVRYLREVGPAVWRSGRVPHEQVRRIADEAERALIPALKRRDVRL